MSFSTDRVIDLVINGKTRARRNIRDPCAICSKKVKSDHKAIQCDMCDQWVHITCNGNSEEEYERLKIDDNVWHCVMCIIKFNLIHYALHHL